ncbi:alpha/beta fold hydrolase [Mycobacterium sp. Marseille-P9652]|uniref:alpha/beta fold hydrolase n=1 Tax=Mycobacterium sp. Marseille-P9652 TaxID=2654950 RepID=UPI001E3238B4|nr:alpha/beta hydrolase [Mycobacterium sp. Marseille-P9652]
MVARIENNPDPYPRERLATEQSGEEHFIARPDGTVLRAVTAGAGPSIVFAHGYGGTLGEWNIVWDRLLARGHRLIAFDQRGHGRSTLGSVGAGSAPMAEDYAAVLRHFGVEDGVLVGHSMGGFVAVRAVLDHSEVSGRLRGLVLFATWAGRIHDGAPQNRLQIPLMKSGLMGWLVRTRVGGVLFGAAQSGATPSPAMISVFIEIFDKHIREHGPLTPILRAFGREDRYPRLGEISIPTVVMIGSADRSTPPTHSQRLAAGIPGARLVTVPDAGHLLNWEGADALVDVVESLSPGSRADPAST